jgi:uncharacterized protein YndB with AHSA1/START domain
VDDTSTEHSPVHGSATVRIDASPEAVFALLTDLERLPELSPENQRCELLDGSSEVGLGARFRGYNRAGDYEWHADCAVTVFEPGRRFAYMVPPDFEHATEWSYTIEPDGDGSVVTEAFHAPLLALPEVYPGRIEGRRDNLETACRTTMANLKATLER